MSKQEGTPIYTESAYKNGQNKARGAILADLLTELQAVESQAMRHGELYNPTLKLSGNHDDYRDGFLAALQYIRIRFEMQHHEATRQAKKLIGKASSQAYSLIQCANILIEIANGEDDDTR